MYKVLFESVTVYEAPSIEPCLAFALELHRISNVPHRIGVVDTASVVVVKLEAVSKDGKVS